MRRFRIPLAAAALFALLAGCRGRTVVVHDNPPSRSYIVEGSRHDPEIDVAYDDASFVVYREYYGCSDEEISFIPYYRRYYAVDDGDLFFLFFVARHTRRPIDVVIRSYYYDCDRNYDRLVVSLNMDRAVFFVSLPHSYSPGGAYERPYRSYRRLSYAKARFTNVEFRSLVALKIGVEYQGERPEEFISRVRENPAAPQKAIFRSRDSMGKGGRDVEGHGVRIHAQRAWTMPEKEKREFHEERHQRAARSERPFEERHPQRVKENRQDDRKLTPARKDREGERDRREPKDAEREKEDARRKQVENEREIERQRRQKAPKDAEQGAKKREKAPKKREKGPKEPGKPRD